MNIGVLGGTGDMGRGLSVRLALKHHVLIGSRSKERADTTASALNNYARGFYGDTMKGSIRGLTNDNAIIEAEVVIAALPADIAPDYIKGLAPLFTSEKILVSTVVPMTRKRKLFYWTPVESTDPACSPNRSAAEAVRDSGVASQVVSAFQTVPAAYLYNIDSVLNIDVLMAGDDELSLAKVGSIVRDIPNLRALRVGPLENSRFIESITPLLLNVAILNGLHDPTIRIVPWLPPPE